MPRIARQVEDGGIYHLLNRGNGRQRIFQKDADYRIFTALLRQMLESYTIQMYAYCLMPNHFHLLVKAQKGEDLPRGMQWFTTTHVRRYHRHFGTSGHLWQGRYKSFPVRNDDQLLTVTRYVEGNPVRAGLVETAAGWVWSSHRERCGLEGNAIIAPLPLAVPSDWTTYVDTPITGPELAKVKRAMERQTKAP